MRWGVSGWEGAKPAIVGGGASGGGPDNLSWSGSRRPVAEVPQDPGTQGVAARVNALFGVGSALGAVAERDRTAWPMTLSAHEAR